MWRGFKFVRMKGHVLLHGGDNSEIVNFYSKYIKTSSPEPLGQFEPNLAQSILGWRGFKFVQMKGHTLFQWVIIAKM